VMLLYFPAVLHAVWVISTIGPNGREEPNGTQTFVSLIVAFFLPPVGVFMKKGVGMPLILNIVLSVVLFWLPGVVHAAWVITKDD
jgi:uncharacterized membrane protein YqaE (UPF0057 family)